MLIFLVEVVVLGYNQVWSKNLSFSFSILPYFSNMERALVVSTSLLLQISTSCESHSSQFP